MPDQTFASFADLAEHLRERDRMTRAEDVRRAQNLARSRSIANVKSGTGPRVAR